MVVRLLIPLPLPYLAHSGRQATCRVSPPFRDRPVTVPFLQCMGGVGQNHYHSLPFFLSGRFRFGRGPNGASFLSDRRPARPLSSPRLPLAAEPERGRQAPGQTGWRFWREASGRGSRKQVVVIFSSSSATLPDRGQVASLRRRAFLPLVRVYSSHRPGEAVSRARPRWRREEPRPVPPHRRARTGAPGDKFARPSVAGRGEVWMPCAE